MNANTLTTITLDNLIAGDAALTYAEAQTDIDITGIVSGNISEGDTVTVSIDNNQFIGVVSADNTFTVSVPGSTLASSETRTVTASVETTDSNGNTSFVNDSKSYSAYESTVSSVTLLNNGVEGSTAPGWTVNLDQATIEDTTVTLSANDTVHSASYGSDYSGVMQVFSLSGEFLTEVTLSKENKFKADITVPAGEEGVVVYAITSDDNTYEGDETIVIRAITGNNWVNSEAAVISDESDKPTVASVSDATVKEGGQAEFAFTLSNPSNFDTRVLVSPQADNTDIDFANLWIDLGNGWVQANGEVTTEGTWITVPSSVKQVKLRVDVLEDNEVEGNETITVNVLAEGQNEAATGTITVVDVVATPPVVESISVLEEGVESGQAPAFQLNLTNAYFQDTEVTLNVNDNLHDFDFGKDYDGAIQVFSLSGELLDEINLGTHNAFKAVTNIPAGEESVIIRVNVIDDNLYEGDESLVIRAAVSGKQGWVVSGAATITDETDIVTVAAVSDTTVFEGNHAELTVTMSNPSTTNNTVLLTPSNSNDIDLENVSVNFGKGWVNASVDSNTNQISIDVPGPVTLFKVRFDTISDNIYEGDETFTISANVDGQTESVSGNVTIKDIAGVPTVDNIVAVRDGIEGGDAPGFKVNMTNVSASDTTVTLNMVDSLHDVKYGVDYSGVLQIYSVSGEFLTEVTLGRDNKFKADITVPAGDDGVVVYVMTTDDAIYEGPESVVIRAAVSGEQGWVNSEAALITDENDITLVTSMTDVSVNEGQQAQTTVTLSGASIKPVEVTLTAQIDDANIALNNLSVNFGDGWVSVSGTTFTVPASVDTFEVRFDNTDNDVYNGDQIITLTASTSEQTDAVTSTVTINDDADRPLVNNITVVQEDEEGGKLPGYQVNMTNTSTTDTTFKLTLSDGLHTSNFFVDYTGVIQVYSLDGEFLEEVALSSANRFRADVTVPAGESGVLVYIESVNDDIYEGDETLVVRAGVLGQQGWVNSDAATITDEEDRPSVSSITYLNDGSEDGQAAGFTLNMSNASTTPTTVQLRVDDALHQATIGEDYSGVMQIYSLDGQYLLQEVTLTSENGYIADIVIPAWAEGVTIYAEILSDKLEEIDESLVIQAAIIDEQDWVTSEASTIIDIDNIAPGEGKGPNGTDEAPVVVIPEATGGVGEEELTDGVEVLVTPPTGTLPGDNITVTVTQPDGTTNEVTTTVPAGWTDGTAVPVTLSPEDLGGTGGELPGEGDYTITATVTDTAGNTSVPSEETGFNIDTTAPGEGTGTGGTNEAPTVVIPEATGGVGEEELADGVEVLVTPPTGTQPGDTITVTVTQPDGTTNEVTTTVPGGWTDGTAVPVTLSPEDLGGTGGELPEEGDYTITATVTDTAGNTSVPSEETGFTIDTTAPGEGTGTGGTNEAPTVVIPEATGGVGEEELTDGVEVLVTPPTGTQPGDTITVTVTQPDGTTNEVTTTVPGSWTDGTAVPVTLSPEDLGGTGGELPGEGDYTITTTVTDSAGNTSAPSTETGFTVDTTAPGEGTGTGGTNEAPIVVIPEATGGVGEEELTDGVEVLVTPPTGTQPGDTITVTVTQPDGTTNEVTTTVPGGWTDGTAVPVTLSPEDLGGTGGELPEEGDYTITTTVTDSAGNTSAPSSETSFTIDTTAPGEGTGTGGTNEAPIVVIPEATGGVGEEELTDGVEVLVTPPTGTLPGDTITVTVTQPDGTTNEVTTTVPGGWTDGTAVPVTLSPEDLGGTGGELPGEGDYTITATVTDSAGNTSAPSTETGFTIDTTAPGEGTGTGGTDEAPTVVIPEATGGVGEEELTDGVEVLVTPPTGTKPGDTITVTVTQPDGTTNEVTTTVPGGWTDGTAVPVTLSPEDLGGTGGELPDEGDYTITATVTDTAGNTSAPSTETGFTIDTSGPDASSTQISIDSISADNIVNAQESSESINVTGTVAGEFNAGDQVTVSVNGNEFTGTVSSSGQFSIAVPGSQFVADPDSAINVQLEATDSAGNTGIINATQNYSVDLTAQAFITLDANIADDGAINYAESQQNIDITGVVRGDVKPGDVVTVTVNNVEYTGSVKADNTFSVAVSGADLAAAADKTVTATVTATDNAGNTVTVSDAETYTAFKAKVESVTQLRDGVEGGIAPGWTVNFDHAAIEDTTVRLNFNDSYHQADFGKDYSGKVFIYNLAGQKVGEEILSAANNWRVDISVPAGQKGVRVYAETLNDNVYEGNETIQIQAAVPGRQGFIQSDEAVITDEADKPKVSAVSNATVDEGGMATLTVSLSNESTSSTRIFIDAYGNGGTATEGKDFNTKDLWVNYGSGWVKAAGDFSGGNWIDVPANTKTFQIRSQTTQDDVYEGNETYLIKAKADGQSALISGTVTINDQADLPMIDSITHLRDGVEGGSWPGWTINMTNASTTNTTVQLNFNDGLHQADFGNDYSGKVHVYSTSGTFLQEVVLNASNGWRANINVPAGQQGVRVYAETLNDNVYEGNETFQIQAGIPGRQSLIESEQAVITDEADKPRVTNVSNASANEGDAASVTITLSNESTTPTRVFIDAYGGSATEGKDFNTKDLWVNYGSGWVKAAGDFSGGNWVSVPANTKTFQVRSQTTEDGTYEGNESYTIKAKADGQSNLVSGTVTIVEDEAATIVTSVTKLRDGVEGGTAPGWTVNFNNPSDEATTVRLNFNDGYHQADFGKDYSGKVFIYNLAGQKVGEEVLSAANNWRVDISVPAGQKGVRVYAETLNDNVYEGNETIQIQAAVPGRQGFIQSAEAVITDEADKPRVTNVSNASANEGDAASVTITLSNESTTPTRVFIDAYGGSATEGKDFNTKDLWVNYGSGWVKAAGDFSGGNWISVPANTKTFQVRSQTTEDGTYEGNESYTIKAKADGQGSLVSGTVTIVEDEAPTIVTSVTKLRDGVEGSTTPGWTVNFNNPADEATTVRLNFNDSYHQAKFGEDYSGKVFIYNLAGQKIGEGDINAANNYRLDISVAAGQNGVRIYAQTLNDNVYEGNETIQIQAAVPGRQDFVQSAEAVITDEADKPRVTSVSNASANEGDAASVTITLSNESTTPTRVFIDAYGGSATEGKDFNTKDLWVNYGSGWVKATGDFSGGNWISVPANTKTFQVRSQTTEDGTYEGNESYTIKAKADGQGSLVSGTVTIVEDEAPTIVTSVTKLRDGVEGSTTPGWTVNFNNPADEATTVRLNFNDSYHQAKFGEDYSGKVFIYNLAGQKIGEGDINAANNYRLDISVAAGQSGVRVYAQTLNDNVYEGNETIQIQAAVPGRQGFVQSAEAVITDEADRPAWKISNATTTEGDFLVWDISVHTATKDNSWTKIEFANGTGTIGTDTAGATNFQASYDGGVTWGATKYYGNQLIVPKGTTSFKVRLATKDDSVYEGNETITIKVTESGGGRDPGVVFGTTTSTATITDAADIPKVASITAFQNAAEDGWVGWNLNMTNTSTTNSTVQLNFNDGIHQADIGKDYNGKVHVYTQSGTFLKEVVLNASNGYKANITIPAGQTGVKVYADTLNDNVFEGNETIKIQGAVIGQQGWVQSSAAVITDDADIPKVASITHLQNAAEAGWVGWNLNMTNTSTTNSTVQLNFNDGLHQADFGADYNGKVHVYSTSGAFLQEVVLNASNGYKANITVPAGHSGVKIYAQTLNDSIYEGNETIKIQGAVIGQQGWVQSANAVITDDEAPTIVTSVTKLRDGVEGSTTPGWTVNFNNPADEATTVRLNFNDSYHQAKFGEDYSGKVFIYNLAGQKIGEGDINAANNYRLDISVAAGQSGVRVYAQTLNDNVYEGNETIQIQAAVPGRQGFVQSAEAVITDEADRPAWKISNATTTEGDFLVWDISVHTATKDNSWTKIEFANGTGTIGTDTTGATNFQASYDGGVTWGATKYYGNQLIVPKGTTSFKVRLATKDDSVYEGNETITIKVTESGGGRDPGVVFGTTTSTATITDDADAPKVASITHLQNGVENSTWPGWTVNLTNTSTTSTKVQLNFNDGLHQADFGADYNGKVHVYTTSGAFLKEVNLNSSNGWRADIEVPAGHSGVRVYAQTLNDNVYEGNETIKIQGAVIGRQGWVQSQAAVITDEADAPKVASITHLQNGVENSTWPGWTVNLTNTSTTSTKVQLNFNDGLHEADFGADYNGKVHVYTTSGTFLKEVNLNGSNGWRADIEVPAGHSGVRIYAQTLNDNVYEGNETIKIQGAVIGRQGWVQSQAAVITDEADKPTLSVVNTNGNNSVTESNWATFTIKLSKAVDQATKVKVNVFTGSSPDVNNKDMGGYEYWTGSSWANFKSGSQLTFAAYQTEILVRAKPINDNKVEGNERLIVKAKPIVGETHIGGGEVQSAITVIDKGYRDTSNDTSGHVHWHLDGGGTQHVNGNGWRPHEKVTVYNPNGSTTVIYADKHGFFNIQAENLYTVAGTLNAKGAQSGWAVKSKYVNPSITPLVLDLDGDGIETSDVTEKPVNFDYDGDGKDVKTGWITGGDGLLVRDINKDGQINDGSELFGSNTRLADGSTAADGYEALAQHDSNADGVIDKNDAIYSELNVWVDKDQDGVTDADELLSMEDAKVASIDLAANFTSDESNNNTIGKSSTYTTTDGEERTVADVWFATQQGDAQEEDPSNVIEEHNISGLDQVELVWHSEDVANQPWSDTVTDFSVGEPPLNLSDLVTDDNDNLLSEDDIDMFEQDGSLILRVDTTGDHVWNQEIILQDITLDDIVDNDGMIKNGVFSDDNVKELFQKAASVDALDNSTTHLDDPNIDDH